MRISALLRVRNVLNANQRQQQKKIYNKKKPIKTKKKKLVRMRELANNYNK